MKAMGGQRQLYEAVMNDPHRPSPHPSWREVRAWHAAQRVNALSRPANKSSKSLANPVVRSKLAPCARLGFDSVVMQAPSAKKDATKMGDQGFKGFLNIVDHHIRVAPSGRSPSCWSGMSPPEPICRAHASCHMRRQTLQQGGKGTLAVQPRCRALNGLLQPLSPTAQRDYQDYGKAVIG
jgi:hypothetical protein